MTRLENSTLTQYVYDGGECAQERDSAGSLTKTLIRGSGLGGGIGSILYSEKPSQPREYFLYNVIGSVVVTCNQAGNAVSTSLYEAFGKVIASTGSSDNNRLFCTKERSESIGLDNFGFRYFDWEIGRFIQRDPSGYPDGLNNYLYCSNNPLNKIDPLGLYIETAWDAFNISVGVGSLIDNIKSGNYKAAIVDAAGIVVDGTAAALPGVPGGCGVGIRAARAANKTKEIVEQTAKKLLKKNADEAVQAVATRVVKNTDEAVQAVATPVAKNADEAVKTATNTAKKELDNVKTPQARGRESEARVLNDIGETKNTSVVQGNDGTKTIPDFINDNAIGEIKDTKKVSNTAQIKAQQEAAINQDKKHQIYTGTDTKVSKNVSKQSEVIRRDDLGPKK